MHKVLIICINIKYSFHDSSSWDITVAPLHIIWVPLGMGRDGLWTLLALMTGWSGDESQFEY